jgi:hypothetical protein
LEGSSSFGTADLVLIGTPERRLSDCIARALVVRVVASATDLQGGAMKRLALLAVLAASAAVAVLASSGSASHPGSRTLTFIERDRGSTFSFVDNVPRTRFSRGEPRRISSGDEFVFTTPLVRANGQLAGREYGQCVAVRGSTRFDRVRFQCHATVRFGDGTLALLGIPSFRGPFSVAITGGTGAYEDAEGSARFAPETRSQPATATFHFSQ